MSAYPQFAFNTDRDVAALLEELAELGFEAEHMEVPEKRSLLGGRQQPQFRHAIALTGYRDYAAFFHYAKGSVLDPKNFERQDFLRDYAAAARLIYDFADGDVQYSRSGGSGELGPLDWYPPKEHRVLDAVAGPVPRVEIRPEEIAEKYLPDMNDSTRYIMRKPRLN